MDSEAINNVAESRARAPALKQTCDETADALNNNDTM